ncbi:hypothetical protein ACP70R_019773 [Stipagrostis hirtigluma subsp. patula]
MADLAAAASHPSQPRPWGTGVVSLMVTTCSSPLARRTRRMPDASNFGILPADMLFDVLLCLPAKDLCRLRVICRPWRSLTSDPLFIKAHTARHPETLFLATFRDNEMHIDIMDLSGNVMKRIGIPNDQKVQRTRLDLVCMATERNSCCVVNPATGAVHALPESPAKEHMGCIHLQRPFTSFTFGHVASTGEYKVLRIFNRPEYFGPGLQLCEAFTINHGASDAPWRGKQSRDFFVECQEANSGVVVDGVVYFLMDSVYDIIGSDIIDGLYPDFICSFDLETEEWREDIQGPISSNFVWDVENAVEEYMSIWNQLSLVELEGYLALVYHRRHQSTMDLWFLTDYDTRSWVKEYSIQTELIIPANGYSVKPLMRPLLVPLVVLNDGRIVIWQRSTGLMHIYDPIASTFTEMEMRPLAQVGLYTGSPLSLQNSDMV